MADAFFTTNGNVRAIGSIRRGANGQPQSLEASIPDGDTAGIHIEGSGSVRFLGVDTPEKNFSLAGSSAQRGLDSAMPRMSPIASEILLPMSAAVESGVRCDCHESLDHGNAGSVPGIESIPIHPPYL